MEKTEEQNLGLLLPKFKPKKRRGERFLVQHYGLQVKRRKGEMFLFKNVHNSF